MAQPLAPKLAALLGIAVTERHQLRPGARSGPGGAPGPLPSALPPSAGPCWRRRPLPLPLPANVQIQPLKGLHSRHADILKEREE